MVNLLIVDDEINIGVGIRDNIDWDKYGIRVCGIAENGVQALDLLISTSPDIIIMDIYMPQMGGIELLEIVNDKYPNIRSILISGFQDFEYARQAVNLNAFAFISKPINDQELLQTVLGAKEEIQNRFKKLQNNAIVTAKIKENLSILKDNFLSRLVKGWYKDMDQISVQSFPFEINLDYEQFLVGLIVRDTMEEGIMPTREMDESLYRAVILSRLDIVFNNKGFYFFNLENGIGILLGADRIDRKYLHNQLDDLIKKINEEAGFSVTVVLGKVCEQLSDIPMSYRTAISALDYKIVIGNNQVIDSDNFSEEFTNEGNNINFHRYLHNIQKEVLIALKSINKKALNQWVKDVGEILRKTVKNDIKQKSNALLVLSFYLYYIESELGIYGGYVPYGGSEIFYEMNRLSDLSEIKKYIKSLFEKIMTDIKHKDKDQRSYLIDRAKKYINDNIHEQVSLVSVADYLNIHPSYLSKTFKTITGETFTDFVVTLKMSEAENLLNTTNMRIYEISQLLQYNDPGYFTKLFRKIYGVSPNEYRQLQL